MQGRKGEYMQNQNNNAEKTENKMAQWLKNNKNLVMIIAGSAIIVAYFMAVVSYENKKNQEKEVPQQQEKPVQEEPHQVKFSPDLVGTEEIKSNKTIHFDDMKHMPSFRTMRDGTITHFNNQLKRRFR